MGNDPRGFGGIRWGTSLADIAELSLIEPGERFKAYTFKNAPPQLGNIKVEYVKFHAIDDQFARVTIRYQGEETHKLVMNYLESTFGKVDSGRGSMIRGLNQQYTWRGTETEVNLSYRGLGERGFITVESRVLSPAYMDILSEHSH